MVSIVGKVEVGFSPEKQMLQSSSFCKIQNKLQLNQF